MAVGLVALATRIDAATDAAVATAIGGGTTAAEVTALRSLLNVLGGRRDLCIPPLKLTNQNDLTP